MQYRTDLALELDEAFGGELTQDDLFRQETDRNGIEIRRIEIRSNRAVSVLGKPKGVYITAKLPPLSDCDRELEEMACEIGDALRELLPESGTILVAGLGNRAITPDALGPQTASMVLATRHIGAEFARAAGLEDLRPTAVIAPGVLGKTGVETGEILRGICQVVSPAAVIAVDALAAHSVERLGCTVQLCNSGISPGSGVGNHRQALDEDSLGVPVFAVGVPTVVDTGIIAAEWHGDDPEKAAGGMMVTPREIDLIIQRASKVTAMAINYALQPAYSPAELIAVAQ